MKLRIGLSFNSWTVSNVIKSNGEQWIHTEAQTVLTHGQRDTKTQRKRDKWAGEDRKTQRETQIVRY